MWTCKLITTTGMINLKHCLYGGNSSLGLLNKFIDGNGISHTFDDHACISNNPYKHNSSNQ